MSGFGSYGTRLLRSAAAGTPCHHHDGRHGCRHRCRTMATHTVRVIVRQDLPHGHGYLNDVVHVKPGYARNYLVPQKKAVYATRQNFAKFHLTDPDMIDTVGKQQEQQPLSGRDDEDLKAADLLRSYLRNKTLKIWRNVPDASNDVIHPGTVTAKKVKQKLSTQLKIDLEPHEKVHLRTTAPLLPDDNVESLVQDMLSSSTIDGTITQLGEYLACISLRGDHHIPLKVEVLKR